MPRFRKTENSGEENERKAEAVISRATPVSGGRSSVGPSSGTAGQKSQTGEVNDRGAENGKELPNSHDSRGVELGSDGGEVPAVHDIVGGDQGGNGTLGEARKGGGREGGLLQTDSAGVEESTAGRCNCGIVHLPLPWEQHHVPWACVVSPG